MARRKPIKPSPDFPLYPHASGSWVKKIKGKLCYFGSWDDPAGALAKYEAFKAGEPTKVPAAPSAGKPRKPSDDYPLYAEANGQWAKVVRRKKHYFGSWDNPQAALDKWNAQKDDLLAGRKPARATGALTVGGLVNHFLNFKTARVKTGEIKQRTWDDYETVANMILEVISRDQAVENLRPDDFERVRVRFAKTHGPVALLNDINRARTIFNYGDETFRVRPFYGQSFAKPTKAVIREAKNKMPKKLFNAIEIQELIDTAKPPLTAMILLGINCGFGNRDCAMLCLDHLDLDEGWHSFPRPKTGIERRCPLWPETIMALRDWLAVRPEPKDKENERRVFLMPRGGTWERTKSNGCPISKKFTKDFKVREGRGFYSLRHTFETIGDATGNSVATSFVMGHAPRSDDMGAVYREHTFDEQIAFVVNFVRDWALTRTERVPEHSPDISPPAGPGRPTLRLYDSGMPEEPPQSRGNAAS